jgi:hypothetical protein
MGLNERQVQALALMVNEGREFDNHDYCKLFGVTAHSPARLDLAGQS